MARIVIGTRHTGEHDVLYCGDSGVEAEAALEGASGEDFVLVEYIPFPSAAKRRKFPRIAPSDSVAENAEVPESGTKAKPKKAKK